MVRDCDNSSDEGLERCKKVTVELGMETALRLVTVTLGEGAVHLLVTLKVVVGTG